MLFRSRVLCIGVFAVLVGAILLQPQQASTQELQRSSSSEPFDGRNARHLQTAPPSSDENGEDASTNQTGRSDRGGALIWGGNNGGWWGGNNGGWWGGSNGGWSGGNSGGWGGGGVGSGNSGGGSSWNNWGMQTIRAELRLNGPYSLSTLTPLINNFFPVITLITGCGYQQLSVLALRKGSIVVTFDIFPGEWWQPSAANVYNRLNSAILRNDPFFYYYILQPTQSSAARLNFIGYYAFTSNQPYGLSTLLDQRAFDPVSGGTGANLQSTIAAAATQIGDESTNTALLTAEKADSGAYDIPSERNSQITTGGVQGPLHGKKKTLSAAMAHRDRGQDTTEAQRRSAAEEQSPASAGPRLRASGVAAASARQRPTPKVKSGGAPWTPAARKGCAEIPFGSVAYFKCLRDGNKAGPSGEAAHDEGSSSGMTEIDVIDMGTVVRIVPPAPSHGNSSSQPLDAARPDSRPDPLSLAGSGAFNLPVVSPGPTPDEGDATHPPLLAIDPTGPLPSVGTNPTPPPGVAIAPTGLPPNDGTDATQPPGVAIDPTTEPDVMIDPLLPSDAVGSSLNGSPPLDPGSTLDVSRVHHVPAINVAGPMIFDGVLNDFSTASLVAVPGGVGAPAAPQPRNEGSRPPLSDPAPGGGGPISGPPALPNGAPVPGGGGPISGPPALPNGALPQGPVPNNPEPQNHPTFSGPPAGNGGVGAPNHNSGSQGRPGGNLPQNRPPFPPARRPPAPPSSKSRPGNGGLLSLTRTEGVEERFDPAVASEMTAQQQQRAFLDLLALNKNSSFASENNKAAAVRAL